MNAHIALSLCSSPSAVQLLLELPDGKTELLKVCHTSMQAHSIASCWQIAVSSADTNVKLTLRCHRAVLFGSVTLSHLQFRPDLTVGYVKVEVAKKHGIPFDCQVSGERGDGANPYTGLDWFVLATNDASGLSSELTLRPAPRCCHLVCLCTWTAGA